jgi:hypothetical protein
MDQLGLSVSMSPATVEALRASGAALFALLGVYGANRTGQPTAWLRATGLSETMSITCSNHLGAYLANVTDPIVAMESWPIAPGQGLVVPATGEPTVEQGVVPGWVSIVNHSAKVLTTGLTMDSKDRPIVAFTLHGNNALFLQPSRLAFLMLSAEPAPGLGIVDRATGPGVLVDLSTAPSARLDYDIDKGWSWQPPVQAEAVPLAAPLQPLLVRVPPDPPDAAAVLARLARRR